MKYDPLRYGYPSRRSMVFSRKGMVATSQPLAAGAGLDMLKKGGNAVDAAIAAAACMTVLEPTSNGLGSDAFSILWMKDRLYGLNASGYSPASITAEKVRALGYDRMPMRGWLPVMVPGAPGAWAALSERFGRLPFTEVLEPAIRYAEEGYAVTPVISELWASAFREFSARRGEFGPWMEMFAPDGHAPAAGEVWGSKDLAASLRAIAETRSEAFYRGDLAEKIGRYAAETGGFLTYEDMADYSPSWVEPVHVRYRGHEIWEIPPNGDGIIVLMALAILEGMELDREHPDAPENVHKIIEALKLAYEDGLHYIADPRFMTVKTEDLISEAYAAARRGLIGESAILPAAGNPVSSGTIYLCAADGEGNMVSYIQSNYRGFGSGIVVPGTGISLQDRGFGFSLDPASPNVLAPRKKSFHTIIPGFITKDYKPVGPFGVMGGFMQPQGQLQVVTNLLEFGMNPQEALDRPRWQWIRGKEVETEPFYPEDIRLDLIRRGHDVRINPDRKIFGRGQVILRDEAGTLAGASEPRADGAVIAW